jgi:phage replication O-like protein O
MALNHFSNSKQEPKQSQAQASSAGPQRKGIPQLEDGFARIANEILEAIARTPLSDYESRCVHFLWRKTYGWRNPTSGESKKVDVISRTQWAEGTDMLRRHVDRVLIRLTKRNIITKQIVYRSTRPKRVILWGFQKRYKEWLSPKQVTLQIQLSPNQVIGEVSPKAVTDKTELSPKQVTSPIQPSLIQRRVSPKQVTISSPKQVHTKDNKDTLTRDKSVVSTPPTTRAKSKPYQVQAGIFLDLVEERENIKIINRGKAIKAVRAILANYPGTMPEKLYECFAWLRDNDSFLHNKEPPAIISFMPDKFPTWLAGKLQGIGGDRYGHQPGKGVRPKPHQERRRPIKYIKGSGEYLGGQG